jgi:hypothetical protein
MRDTRFVAHLDILGMSSIVERDADAAWGLLSDLVGVRERAEKYELEFVETNECLAIPDVIKSVTFSDTILLFTRGSTDSDLRCMLVCAAEMFHKALCSCVPVRIGISLGTFYFNIEKSMYAGPALIDAYRIGESAQWLGIALSESVRKRALDLNMTSGKSQVVVEWALPVKGGTKSSAVLNWPAAFAHDIKVKPPISVSLFYQAFERSFGALDQLAPEVRLKYENTVEFMNARLHAHAIA